MTAIAHVNVVRWLSIISECHRMDKHSADMDHSSGDMLYLPAAWHALATPRFDKILKAELESLSVEQLPLQQCMSQCNHVVEQKPDILILGADDIDDEKHIRIGVFFSGLIAGCSCADDPTPVEPITEYCEFLLRMNKQTGYITIKQAAS